MWILFGADQLERVMGGPINAKKNMRCGKCEQSCWGAASVEKHRLAIYLNEIKPFSCDKCEKKYGQRSHLVAHERNFHEKERLFECPKCEKTFGLKSHCDDHIKICGRKPFVCKKCGRAFVRKHNFEHHKKNCPLPESYACTKCGEIITRKYLCDAHIKKCKGTAKWFKGKTFSLINNIYTMI